MAIASTNIIFTKLERQTFALGANAADGFTKSPVTEMDLSPSRTNGLFLNHPCPKCEVFQHSISPFSNGIFQRLLLSEQVEPVFYLELSVGDSGFQATITILIQKKLNYSNSQACVKKVKFKISAHSAKLSPHQISGRWTVV